MCTLLRSLAGSMSWGTYVWYLAWLVISAGVYCLYSIHHVEVPYEAIASPVQRPVPCLAPVMKIFSKRCMSFSISCAMSHNFESGRPTWYKGAPSPTWLGGAAMQFGSHVGTDVHLKAVEPNLKLQYCCIACCNE